MNPSRLHFHLSGGGLAQTLRRRLRGGEARPLSIRMKIALSVLLLWLPPAILSLVAGTFVGDAVTQPFWKDVIPQVRLLLTLPLLFIAGKNIDPALELVVQDLDESGVIADADRPQYRAAFRKLEEARDSTLADAIMLVLAISLSLLPQSQHIASTIPTAVTSSLWSMSEGKVRWTAAGAWYAFVSVPVFRFVILRWAWRFVIWARFLYRVSRLPLALRPTHPDLAGGVGIVGFAQLTFVLIFVAIGSLVSSTIAQSILFDGAKFIDARPEMFAFLVSSVLLICAPLLFFANPLYECRRRGLSEYAVLGQRLSQAFSAKWIELPAADVGTALKSSSDASAMADYGATFALVENMRVIPVPPKGVMRLVAALLIPFFPLYFTEFSVTDLLERMSHVLM